MIPNSNDNTQYNKYPTDGDPEFNSNPTKYSHSTDKVFVLKSFTFDWILTVKSFDSIANIDRFDVRL